MRQQRAFLLLGRNGSCAPQSHHAGGIMYEGVIREATMSPTKVRRVTVVRDFGK
jgi:hypothetical protein